MKISANKAYAKKWFAGLLVLSLLIATGNSLYGIWRRYQLNHVSLPAFPSAEGFGASTQGGRFGRIIFVTNVFDTTDVHSLNYLGSLRWAVNHTWEIDPLNPYSERRIIVFRVGGTVELVDKLIVKNPYITIAGQTAPGDGILLKGDEFVIATHDVIVRGIRVRVGDQGTPTCCRDGISIGTFFATGDVYNVIVDHSSVSWAVDENFSIWSDPAEGFTVHNITLQWNIISQGLHDSIHVDEEAVDGTVDPHSMGLIIGNQGRDISVHHNLLALNDGRNPRIDGIDSVEIINNVIYGWGGTALEISESQTRTHILGNYFKSGNSSSSGEILIPASISPASLVFLSENMIDDPRYESNSMDARILLPEGFYPATKLVFAESDTKIDPSLIAYQQVLDYAGAITQGRDQIDRWVVDDVKSRKGSIIDSQDQMGGWPAILSAPYPQDSDFDGIPDDWEIEYGSSPTDPYDASNFANRAPSGYTWIEEYINSLLSMNEASIK